MKGYNQMSDRLDQHKILHEDPNVYIGISLIPHVNMINTLLRTNRSINTILDYGSGKGHQYTRFNLHKNFYNADDIQVLCYDPCVPFFDNLPKETFDMVISTDVAEHIPEGKELDEYFNNIYDLANICVYLSICPRKAWQKLPNGENAHATVKNVEWWQEQIRKHADITTMVTFPSKTWPCYLYDPYTYEFRPMKFVNYRMTDKEKEEARKYYDKGNVPKVLKN